MTLIKDIQVDVKRLGEGVLCYTANPRWGVVLPEKLGGEVRPVS